jgi:hypothetical protein
MLFKTIGIPDGLCTEVALQLCTTPQNPDGTYTVVLTERIAEDLLFFLIGDGREEILTMELAPEHMKKRLGGQDSNESPKTSSV